MSCSECAGYRLSGECPCCYDSGLPSWLEDLAFNTFADIRTKIASGEISHSDDMYEILAEASCKLNEGESDWFDEESYTELKEFWNVGNIIPRSIVRTNKKILEICGVLPKEILPELYERLISVENDKKLITHAKCTANSEDHLLLVVQPAVEDAFRSVMFDEAAEPAVKMDWIAKNSKPLSETTGNVVPYDIEVSLAKEITRILYEKYQVSP